MANLDFTTASIKKVITHSIGNKSMDEGYLLSDSLSKVSEESEEYLKKYFLSQIQTVEFHHFSHPVELQMNEVFSIAKNLFGGALEFIEASHSFTKLLYECSMHPKIKTGDLNVVLFDEVIFEDEVVQAIGIYKSENTTPYISMKMEGRKYDLKHHFGYDLKGIDKACLILDTSEEEGYVMMIVDKISGDAQYWHDDFLQAKPLSNDFTETQTFMTMTKKFLTKELEKEVNIDKTERIDMLNKTVEYFKSNEKFDKEEFETSVLKEPEVIESFRGFAPSYGEQNQISIPDSFDISDQAVKKQVRKFRNVLKLDKNFHIYINGDKSLINRGVEADGRKYYKIYYENEA